MIKTLMRPVSLILVISFFLLNYNVPNVQAKMISTDSVIAERNSEYQRVQVKDFLAQEEVTQLLIQYGVDPIEAQKRVDSLSNEELADIAYSLEQMPAGGNGVGAIVGAAVLIFLVLLITDLLGLTHVYPFVNHPR